MTERGGKILARYRGADGKQRSKTFARKTDARKFLAEQQTAKARGTWIDPAGAQIRFDEWALQWLNGRYNLSAATRARDESLLRNHVIPGFGRMPLGRLGPMQAASWVTSLVSSGLSPRSIRDCYSLFSGVMRAAATARLITEAPTVRGVVNLPRVERKPERFLTETEVERLASEIGEWYSPLIFAAAYTGCRWQELAGLKRVYLDLDRAQLHVRGVLERVGGSVSYKPQPKTEAGRRTISLPPLLVRILRDHQPRQEDSEWVFTTEGGAVLRDSNFRRFWKGTRATGYRGAIHRARLAPLTFHDLRHTHAAWLIREGTQPLALQRRLGHKDIRTTMNVYGHLFPNHDDEVVATLNRRWQAAKDSENAKLLSLRSR